MDLETCIWWLIYKYYLEVTKFTEFLPNFYRGYEYFRDMKIFLLSTGLLLNHFCRNNRENNHEGELIWLSFKKEYKVLHNWCFSRTFSKFYWKSYSYKHLLVISTDWLILLTFLCCNLYFFIASKIAIINFQVGKAIPKLKIISIISVWSTWLNWTIKR